MERNDHWVERVHALARTQAHYVWILLVTGLFYFSLPTGTPANGQGQATPVVPFLGIPFDSHQILLTGPFVLSFLVLAFSGAVRAFKRASENALPDERNDTWAAEKLDVYPNAIDMVVYHTENTPRWIVAIGYFGYPFYLTVFLLEAVWIWYVSLSTATGVAQLSISIASVLALGPACWQVVGGWRRRLQIVFSGKHVKGKK